MFGFSYQAKTNMKMIKKRRKYHFKNANHQGKAAIIEMTKFETQHH